jgi:hypothetical protein
MTIVLRRIRVAQMDAVNGCAESPRWLKDLSCGTPLSGFVQGAHFGSTMTLRKTSSSGPVRAVEQALYSQIKIQTLIIKPPTPVLRPKVRFDLIALLPLVFVAHQLKI